ncbi:MAG: PKD domain-containing protein [Flavobacteriales bacterium]|nr:PKD domain-containing protein [Flavobacteriales bacterium]
MSNRAVLLASTIVYLTDGYAQCTANFSHVANWDTVTFTDLSSVANAHYYWNFGDGSTAYGTDPVHVFIEAGTFQVTLHVRDTVSLCHGYHQEWLSISRPFDTVCEPYTTDSIFSYNGTDYVEVNDASIGCAGMWRHIDAVGSQNSSPGNWYNLSNWGSSLTMSRMRYTSNDSIQGSVFRRAYYRSLPYNYDPAISYDTCSADFEYSIDYQPGGAVGTFKPLGPPGADTILISGFGNPIALIGQTSTFTFPYYGGAAGKWQTVTRRNSDPNHACNNRMAHTLIIRNPFYVAPPSCIIDPQPQNAMAYENGSAQFFIDTEPGSTKQWQQNAGLGWQDLFDAGPYSGVTTDTLTVSNCQNWWSNYQYRCVGHGPGQFVPQHKQRGCVVGDGGDRRVGSGPLRVVPEPGHRCVAASMERRSAGNFLAADECSRRPHQDHEHLRDGHGYRCLRPISRTLLLVR